MGFAQGHITVRRKPKDGAAGDSAIRLDLNNENDSLLYDAEGNLLSGRVVSVATLYKGEAAVSSGVVFSISERSGMSTAQATISGSTITVSGLSSSGYVMVAATYNNKTYYAKFSLKRIVGSVKYDLVVTPDAVAYNSTTGTKSASSINVKVFRTAQNGSDGTTREQVSAIPNGYSLKVDGAVVSGYGSNGYTFDVDVTKASHVVTLLQGTTIADEETIPINKSTNGAAGTNGMNTAIVYLYKRAATKPSIDWSGVLTYNFTNKALTSVPDGWSATIPANDGNPLYVTAATAASRTNVYNIAASEWADPVQLNSNGADGGAGLNSATVVLYKRAASEPSAPTSALTYTFATGALSGTLSGWSLVMPETDGNPCWRIQATAISTAATDTIAASEWSAPTKVVVDGEDGSDAFRLDLNNENDSLLYDAEGNLLSGSVQSVATLYKGDTPVESGVTYSISERSGCSSSQATISGNVITVSGLSSSGYVMCKALFNGKSFFSKFSLKRLIGDVKYDLLVTPDAIAYNTTTGTKSSSTINVKVYRTAQNGSNGVDRTLVTSLPSGYSLKIDGTAVTYSGSGGYSFNVDVSRSSHVVSLYNGSTLVDEETVPINKSTNGSDGRDGTDGTDGTDGVDGKDGNSIINRFMWSPTKPDTPTGTALLPSGWSENSDRESISPQYKSEDGSGASSFIVNGVFRQNPAIGDSQTIAERVVFTTTKANQILYIDLHADSESASYDYIAVSKLDNTAWTSNALAKIGGRNVSSVVKVLVPTAGTHFIIVGYRKDSSQSVGKDRGWYRFIPDENLNCWVSQGIVDGETGLVTSWSEPVKYVADSVDEESIYLLANSTATPSTPSSLPYVDDYVPPLVDDEFDSTKAYYSGSKFMYNGKAYNTIATYRITLQYDSTTVYYADDEFIYNGKAYLCIADCPNSGILPTNTDYFDEILPTNSSNYFEEIPTWTDNPSNVSSAYRYQFVCERKKENGQWGAFTTPHLYNTAGISGLDYRIEYWQSGQTYRNDINDIDADPRIIHICTNMPIALYTDPNFRAYQCVKTHTSSSSIPLGASGYWTRINNLGPLITPLVLTGKIIADYIDVNTLYVVHLNAADGSFKGTITVYDSNNNVIAHIGDVNYPLWLGGATAAAAVTKVKADGELVTSKINASGGNIEDLTAQRLRNPFGTISDSFTPIDDDNVVSDVIGGSGLRYSYELDWTTKSSGRRQTIIGAVSITAPSGKYFYENGRKYSEFNSSYECSEMIGYGDDENFWGWIVVRRTLFSTNYNFGREVTPLAMGRVNGSTSGSASFTILKVTNKDNAKVSSSDVMKVAHTGTTGHYYLYCPRSWFVSADYIGVHLTGFGYVNGSTTAPCNCCVAAITATALNGYSVWRIEVVVNDDATPNDGSFFFQLYNMAQWDD